MQRKHMTPEEVERAMQDRSTILMLNSMNWMICLRTSTMMRMMMRTKTCSISVFSTYREIAE